VIAAPLVAAAALSCGGARFSPDKAVDTRNQYFAGRTPLASKADIDRERSAVQDQVLAEYRQCPTCFLKNHKVRERVYLFDAVADCDTTMRVGRLDDGGKWVCNPQMLAQLPHGECRRGAISGLWRAKSSMILRGDFS
jgi:hypothetical protein